MDSSHQIIVTADVICSGSEQSMLLPMIGQTDAYRAPHTLITADTGFHSDANAMAAREAIQLQIAQRQPSFSREAMAGMVGFA